MPIGKCFQAHVLPGRGMLPDTWQRQLVKQSEIVQSEFPLRHLLLSSQFENVIFSPTTLICIEECPCILMVSSGI